MSAALKQDFDVIIVGGGAGGGMAALALCEAGFKVGLIERGPRYQAKRDYILNHLDWGSRPDPLDSARVDEQTVDQGYYTEYQSAGRAMRRSATIYHRVHGVGGSTLHYQGEAHRFAEHAFTTKRDFGWGVDWPFQYKELEPFYQRAEQLLGVAGINQNPHKTKRGSYPTPAHALSAKSQLLKRAAQKAGMSLIANPLALPTKSLDGRTPCQRSGGCNYGCVFDAKSSVDQVIIPKAEKTGNLTLLSETRVLRIKTDKDGEISSLQCKTKQGIQNLRAATYILATGAVETPRLMLHSTDTNNPTGYANHNDQVGRYYMETVMAKSQIELAADIQNYTGPPIDSRIWDFCKPIDANTNGFVLGSVAYLTPHSHPVSHAIKTTGIGRAHKAKVRNSFGKAITLFGIAEQEPQIQNRVLLGNRNDKDGIPMVQLHCEYSQRDQHTIGVMQDKLKAWANAADTTVVRHGASTLYQSSATHVGGSCRMGEDPQNSVVDRFGKVHGKGNCYITDSSVLVGQGAGDSPSLTIQALALRTADKIISDLKA